MDAGKLKKDWIEKNKKQFQTFEENTKTALTFLVGAFVKLMVARWWAQTSKIPKLNRLAIRMNALMREGILFVDLFDMFSLQGRNWWVGRVGNCPPSIW